MFGRRTLTWMVEKKVEKVDEVDKKVKDMEEVEKVEKESKMEKVSTTADEVVSVLQKEIRRGSQDALTWGLVLYENGYAGAAFNRLRVIAMEDAAVKIRLPVVVDALFDEFKSAMKKNNIKKLTETKSCEECKTALLKAIQLLVSSPKTRCLNHALALARKTLVDDSKVYTAKGALDEFNAKIALGDFESTLVAALRVMIWDDKECTFGMWKTMKEMTNFDPLLYTLQKWKSVNESLSIAQALVLVLRGKTNQLTYLSGFDVAKIDVTSLVVGQIPPFLPEVPDYAVDKHTSRGKKMGRGVAHFYTVGALVNNEPFADPWVQRARAWYEEIEKGSLGAKVKAKSKSIIKELLRRWKLVLGVVDPPKSLKSVSRPKTLKSVSQSKDSKRKKESSEDSDATESESDEEDGVTTKEKGLTTKEKSLKTKKVKKFAVPVSLRKENFPGQNVEEVKNSPFGDLQDGVLTQIPCASKPPAMVGLWTMPDDVWSGRRVFLKGPESRERALTQQWFNCIKTKFAEIRPIETRVLKWNDKYYILMEDLSHGWTTKPAKKKDRVTKQDNDITIIKSGEDVDASKIMQEYLRLTKFEDVSESMVKQYLAILMMRQVLGSSDTCNRNILQRGDQLWSVDECVSGKPLMVLIAHITKSLKDQLSKWFVAHRQWCLDLLQTWQSVPLAPYLHRDITDRFDYVRQKVNAF
jgi:hypothetical protein